MATVKGVNKTKIDAGGAGDNILPRGEYAGTVKAMYDTYEASAAASGTLIEVATPPAGAHVIGVQINFDDLGTGTTLAWGDSADADRYLAATDVATAAGSSRSIAITGVNYEIGTATGDDESYLTVGGSAATGTIKTIFYYV